MTNQNQRYIRIARACLKAINQASSNSKRREEDIQNIYQAIDDAFRQEFSTIEEAKIIAEQALKDISQLSSTNSSAPELAQQALESINILHGNRFKH
jgi:cysteinyl-tRNA synthetase